MGRGSSSKLVRMNAVVTIDISIGVGITPRRIKQQPVLCTPIHNLYKQLKKKVEYSQIQKW